MINRLLTLVTLSAVLSTVAPQPVFAFDLNGHWKGKLSCKGFDVQKFSATQKDVDMAITQSGKSLHVQFSGVIYNGSALTDNAKPSQGEVILIGCETDTSLAPDSKATAIVRAAVKTKSGVTKASFSGIEIFEVWLSQNQDEFVLTCKLSFTRQDTNDANVPACPAS